MSVTFNNEKLSKHAALSAKIKESLTLDSGTIKEEKSHSAYFDNLPEGLSEETVKDVAKYNSEFVGATHVAVGELAAEAFNKDKELQKVDAQVGFFGARDKITASVHREKQYNNAFAEKEEDKVIKKALVIQSSVQTSGQGLKALREAMSEEFRDRFAK